MPEAIACLFPATAYGRAIPYTALHRFLPVEHMPVNFSSWTPRERLISGAFFAVAIGCLLYGFNSGVPPLSSEFFSMFAVVSLVIGLALTPRFILQPLRESLGSNLSKPMRIALGFFCAFQLIAVIRVIVG